MYFLPVFTLHILLVCHTECTLYDKVSLISYSRSLPLTRTHTHMHTHTYTNTRTCTHIHEHTYTHTRTRTRTQVREHQKPVDFLARNRRAVHERSRAATDKQRGSTPRGKLPSSGREKPSKYNQAKKANSGPIREETVTISKGYLDQLMRMSVLGAGGNSSVEEPTIARAHVILDRHQVPGLASSPNEPPSSLHGRTNGVPVSQVPSVYARKMEEAHVGRTGGLSGAAPQVQTGLSAHEQWLRDLAGQAEEQRRRKKTESERWRTQTPPGIYFPFGGQGGGAPIKSQSGTLLTDYRTRVIEPPSSLYSKTNGVPQVPSEYTRRIEEAPRGSRVAPQRETGLSAHEQWLRDLAMQAEEQKRKKMIERERQKAQTPQDIYFPFGRPGGGAPIKSESGTLLTDYRTRERVGEETHSETRRKGERPPLPNKPTHRETSRLHSPPPQPHPPTLPTSLPSAHDSTAGGQYSHTPRFARGAGPYVDRFVMEQMSEQRKKQMENMVSNCSTYVHVGPIHTSSSANLIHVSVWQNVTEEESVVSFC